MKQLFSKTISLLLVLAFLVQLVPATVFAMETEEFPIAEGEETTTPVAEEDRSTQDSLPSAQILFEEESLREEDVKHFRLDDGSYIAVQYGTAVHYQDDGKWVDYDNTLQSVSALDGSGVSSYRVVNGDSIRVFAADANAETLLAVGKENYSLSLTPIKEADAELPANPNQPVTASLAPIEAEESSTANVLELASSGMEEVENSLFSQAQPDKIYSALEYADVFGSADLRYENYGNTIKESIVIAASQAEYVYAFQMETEGMTPTLQEDGSILLTASDGAVIYSIPAPYMIDANNEYSYDAAYTLTGESGSYTLTVTADPDWMNAEERAFPVLLDPTIIEENLGDDKVSGTFIKSGYPGGTAGSETGVYVGNDGEGDGMTHSLFHINELIELPAGSKIYEASFSLWQYQYVKQSSTSPDLEIGLYPMTSVNGSTTFDQAVSRWQNLMNVITWNGVYGDDAYYLCDEGTPMADKVTVNSANSGSYVTWNITRLMQEWYATEGSNLGFILKPTSDSAASRVCFYGPEKSSNLPQMMVRYYNAVGLESYYTYETAGIGRAGTSYIGDFAMQNTLVVPLVYSDSNVVPFSLSLVYNSAYATEYFTSGGNIHTRDFNTMQVGAGWKLSLQETITPVTVDGYTYLVYNDSDGTEHYFFYDSAKSAYVDENGLHLEITGSNAAYTLKDRTGNKKIFTYGYLTQIQDVYGNSLYICYNGYDYSAGSTAWKPTSSGANKITSVYRATLGSTPGKLLMIGYSGNRVSTIVSECDFTSDTEKAKRRTTLSVTTVSEKSLLTTIAYSDGASAQYCYYGQADTDYADCNEQEQYRLASAYDGEANYGLEYSYSYNKDVRNLYEYVLSDGAKVYGTKLHGFKRSHNQAVFRYYGDDGVSETDDDMLVFKAFDQIGRTVSSYTTDDSERNILGVGAASYTTNSGTSGANNRLTGSASSGQQGIDLLQNGGGELGTTGWTNATTETTNVLYGSKAFKASDITLYQRLSLNAETTYTFSGYVKVTAGATAKLLVTGGGTSNSSRVIDYDTTGVNDGWARLTLTFTAEAAGSYMLCLLATGTVYADAFQLEEEDAASTYNLLEDGSFESTSTAELTATTATTYWNATPGTWRRINGASVVSETSFPFGSYALSLTGDSSSHHVLQRVDMDCEAGSTFIVSAWAKSTADPDSIAEKATETDPYFGIFVRLRYADQTEEVQFFAFDPMYDGWQYRQGVVAPKEENADKAITDIIVALAYDNNFNTALFDNVSLRMEPAQTYYYDEDGNLKTAAQVGSGTESAEYDENGVDLLKYTAANGTFWEYTYNDAHDVTKAVSDGVTADYTYDAAGNLTNASLSGGGLTMETEAEMTSDYNHTASVTDASGNTTSYTYDTQTELLTQVTNAKGGISQYEYNEYNDRPTTTTQKSSSGTALASISYTYSGGQLSALTRNSNPTGTAKNQTYNFTYNLWGQSTAVKVGSITLASYTYEDLAGNDAGSGGGNLTQMTYGNGNYTTYTYDEFDRLIKTVYNDTTNYVEYVYNAEGSLAELRYGTGTTETGSYAFEYDSLGRLIRSAEYSEDTLVQRTEHLYDSIGRLSGQSWVIGTTAFSESYTYNDPEGAASGDPKDGSLKQMTTATGATIDYGYDGIKRLSGTTVKPEDASTALYTTAYAYKTRSDGKATALVEFRNVRIGTSGTILEGKKYEYDALGNIIGIYESTGLYRQLVAYTYDEQNQLLSETYYAYSGTSTTPATTTVYSYTYDTAGNLLTKAETVDGTTTTKSYTYGNSEWRDLLTKYGSGLIAYEGQDLNAVTGKLGLVTYTVTGTPTSGNPISYYNGTRWDMEWEQGRNLAEAFSSSTNTAVVSEAKVDTENTLTYAYDPDGIRTEKTCVTEVYHYTDSSSGIASVSDSTAALAATSYVRYLYSTTTVTHNYVTQNGKVVRETIGSGRTGKVLDFIYDESGRPFALKYSTNGGSSFTTYYYVLNLQGDVVKLIDTRGTTVASYSYNAWGEILSSSGSMADINPLRYRGYYYDTETGFYYLQSRYYDPVTHRFINADSLASTGQGILGTNMFAYCLNNPIGFADFSGCMALEFVNQKYRASTYENQFVPCGGGIVVTTTLVDWEAVGEFFVTMGEAIGNTISNVGAWVEDNVTDYVNSIADKMEKALVREYRSYKELHHIVAQTASAASPAREILIELFPNGVNEPANQVYLSTKLHRRMHTALYYSLVNYIIETAYQRAGSNRALQRENVLAALSEIKLLLIALDEMTS